MTSTTRATRAIAWAFIAIMTSIAVVGCTAPGPQQNQPELVGVTGAVEAYDQPEQAVKGNPNGTAAPHEDKTDSSANNDAHHQSASFRPSSNDYSASTVTVFAAGQHEVEPDVALIRLGVSDTSSSVEKSRNHVARVSQAIIDAAHSMGVKESDITTSNYGVYPQYDWANGNRFLVGYQVSHDMAITIKNIHQAGALIDLMAATAGNDLEFHSIDFSHANPEPMRSVARANAVEKAHRIAHELAAASNRTLGPLLSVTEGSYTTSVPTYRNFGAEALASAGAYDTPIATGTSTTSVGVQAVFSLQ